MMNKKDINKHITAEMVQVLQIQQELADGFEKSDDPIESMRRNYNLERAYWNDGGPEAKKTIDLELEGPYGALPIRLHYPLHRKEKGIILYIHGGGFMVGNLDTHSRIMRNIMELSGSVVVGIDYHLAPEYQYPVQLEECAFLVKHLRENSEEYDIDANDIVFAGDSAGANLALATTLYLRDRLPDIHFIRALLLYYGTFGLKDSRSMRLYGGDYDGLSQSQLQEYQQMYLGKQINEIHYSDCFDHNLATDIPPCYIACGEIDPLFDDSQLLFDILVENGMKAELQCFNGVTHSFLHFSKIMPEAIIAIEQGIAFYRSLK